MRSLPCLRALIVVFPLAFASPALPQGHGAANLPQSIRQIEEFEARANLTNPPEKILDLVGVRAGMVVGEIGARHGRIAIPLARRVGAAGKVYANDIDQAALGVLRERCAIAGITNLETIAGKVDDPLLPRASLDLALMVWTYHEVSQPGALLKSLAPSLKTGGRLALVEPVMVTREKVEADAAPAGLTIVSVLEGVIERDVVLILAKK